MIRALATTTPSWPPSNPIRIVAKGKMTSPPRSSHKVVRLRSNSRRILAIPTTSTATSSIRSKTILRTSSTPRTGTSTHKTGTSTHKTGTSTPRAAMLGVAQILLDAASQRASMKAGLANILSRVGTDNPPPRTTQTITSTAPANVGLAGMTLMERFPCNAGIRA